MEKLGIIAGRGLLPQKLIQTCIQQQRPFCVVVLRGQFDMSHLPPHTSHVVIRLGAAGKGVAFLHDQQAAELVFAGGVKRPSLLHLRPDWWTSKQLKRIGKVAAGDDGLLAGVVRILEEDEGFHVVGAHEVLPDLLVPAGLIGTLTPNAAAYDDITKGFTVAKELGRLDIGQALTIQQGVVLAVEAAEGTDGLLKRVKSLKKKGAGGALVKVAKPEQELRIDMPTIGAKTLYAAYHAGLQGIAIEAGKTLVLEVEQLQQLADRLGLFLIAVDANTLRARSEVRTLVYIVVGEASGDTLGAQLIQSLEQLYPHQYHFVGVAGPQMQQLGMKSLFAMEELSLMGLTAILPKIFRLKQLLKQATADVLHLHPDVVLTIDSPGFNKRLAKKIRRRDASIPLIHWVAPSVWAWKPKRAKTMAQLFDHLLCLLPFEPPYFEKEGLDTYYVGHPITTSGADAGNGDAFRRRHKIKAESPLLCLLPGSRMSEVKKMLTLYKETIDLLRRQHPDIQIVLPLASAVNSKVKQITQDWDVPLILLEDHTEKFDAFAACQVALASSGTVSVELAMAKVPMVIGYRFGRLTDWLAKRLIKIRYASLVNILQNKPLIPEFLGPQCTPQAMAAQLHAYLTGAEQPDFTAWEHSLSMMGYGQDIAHQAAATFHQLAQQHQTERGL